MMELSPNGNKMIYVRLAEWLEDEILAGTFPEGTKIPSVADLSANFKINHMTVLKGISQLSDSGIIYKSRGVGMFVSEGAVKNIRKRRHKDLSGKYLGTAVAEAKKLGIDLDELIEMVEEEYNNE